MERDFLGLNSKDMVATVKQEIEDECNKDHPVSTRGSGMQWPFLNKKNFNLNGQGGTHYAMMAYPVKHVDHSLVHRPNEFSSFSVSNHMISVAHNDSVLKTHVVTTGHNLAATTMKQEPLGGIPVTASHSIIPIAGSFTGTADPRNILKPAGAPAQLTIFYAGSMSIYNDVPPEKAQAIMFLARNGSSMNDNTTTPRAQVQAPTPKPVGVDGFHGNHSHSTSPRSGLSSPTSVTSHVGAHSGTCSSTGELMAAKPLGASMAPNSQPEPLKLVTSIGSAATTLMPTAVPQARKASLARFLEKRKERVMNKLPYMNKKSPESITTPDSTTTTRTDGVRFPGNSM